MKYEIVSNAFWGIRIAVIALMLKALIMMFKQCAGRKVSYCVTLITLILVEIFHINAVLVIIGAALIGIIYQQIGKGDLE